MMDAPDLNQLQNMNPPAIVREFTGGRIRQEALRDAALSLGTRGGFAKRTMEIKKSLDARSSQLEQIYNFNSLLISTPTGQSKTSQYLIAPPVISEGRNSLKVEGDSELKIADRVYHIDVQARFITAPPNWRGYLDSTPVESVELPDASLMPKDGDERESWKQWIAKGWSAGVKQADIVFENNLNRLNRDYSGMVRYRVLLKQNMVSVPFVAENRMGVTGGGEDMAVDSRVLRITAKPSLQAAPEKWKPIVYGAPDGR